MVEPAERGRAQLLTAVLIGLIVLAAAYAVWFGAYDVSSSQVWSDSILLITAGGLVTLLLTYWLSRGPHWRIAAVTLVVVSNLFMLVVILVAPQSSLDTAWLLVGLLACSLLLSPRVTVILLASLCAVTFILPWLVVTPPWFGTGEAEVLLITVGLLIVAVAVVRRSDLRRLERQAHELIDREATLRDSEERYRVLAESSPDMIFVIDRDDRVRYANEKAAATVGRSAEEAVGMARADLFAAEATGQMNDQMRRPGGHLPVGQDAAFRVRAGLPSGKPVDHDLAGADQGRDRRGDGRSRHFA